MLRRGRAFAPERPEHRVDSDEFHSAVFAAYGKRCHLAKQQKIAHEKGGPKLFKREPWQACMHDALDAAHIVPRSAIGPKHAYLEPRANGRPLCRPCHKLQEAGLIEFSDAEYNAAIRALNKHFHAPLRERG